MQIKKTVMIDEKILSLAEEWVKADSTSFTKILHDALKYYFDYRYMQERATFINEDIKQTLTASVALLEKNLNRKTNRLLTELAIQQGILAMVVANDLEVSPDAIERYRILMVDFLRENNRVFRMDEAVSDA